jgi:predicted kinase
VIILLNGAFGVGKTTVARSVVARLPRASLFNAELSGIALQRMARLVGRSVDDFQDLAFWRRITVEGLRVARAVWSNIVVPMAFSNPNYLREVRGGIDRFEPQVFHFCLVASIEVIHDRLRRRGEDPEESDWQYRRASECCLAHSNAEFATHINAAERSPEDLADEILCAIRAHE